MDQITAVADQVGLEFVPRRHAKRFVLDRTGIGIDENFHHEDPQECATGCPGRLESSSFVTQGY